MDLIIISGPSGSGKTTLAKNILKKLNNGIILNTDNYYKTGIISKILSEIITSYFDRKISFNFKLFKRDLNFILKNGFSNFSYKYNFKSKSIKKIYKKNKNIKFVIIEGIFGSEILKSSLSNNCILIKLKTKKKSCMKRVIKRDFLERGKSKNLAKYDFIKAWELFHENENKSILKNHLKKIVVKDKGNLNILINEIIKFTY